MRKIISLYILIICLCACLQKEAPNEQPNILPQNVLAKVAGYTITQEEFDERAALLDPAFKNYISTPLGKQNFLNYLISERLLQQEALFKNLQEDPEYKKEIENLIKQQEIALKRTKEFLLKKTLMDHIYNEGIIYVSEEEIKAYHKKYPYEIKILQILLNDALEAAQVMNAVKNTKTQNSFKEAVMKFSKDPLVKQNKGALPPFIPGEYLSEIEVPAANSATGQVQGFIQTPLGFHIIMKVGEDRLTYDKAKERIKTILEKQKLDKYLNSLKEKYGVEVKNENK
ncbi:MAG: peptidylprolyl isomerase [Elusimicrobiaceae bacterium]|nr:peptidylprolyl isomerase [Elusimicrobiaceae bacterium]